MPSAACAPHHLSSQVQTVCAAPHWRTVDFISDLHLQASVPTTFTAWRAFMAQTPADALFILGDLFEVWVGDDIAAFGIDEEADFARQCLTILQAATQRMAVYFLHGNRDFLLGSDYATQCGMTLLADPCVLMFDQQRWLLSHGDALCLGDVDYQQFRAKVRNLLWQKSFLATTLAQRQAIAHDLRAQSQLRKASGISYADVDTACALQWLKQAQACTLIHGHTHLPGDHQLDPVNTPELRRLVLSDWDADTRPARLEVLRLCVGFAPQRVSLSVEK